MTVNQMSSQLQTLRLYAELLCRYSTLAGTLTLTHGPKCTATGLAAAVSIAGGTSLLIDPDTPTVKAAFRAGGLDFLVTNLDEALRVLKNEIRKHTPLSVALTADPATVLAEMRERGVEPNLEVLIGQLKSSSGLALSTLHLTGTANVIHSSPQATEWLASHNWSESFLLTKSTADLRALDERALSLIPEGPRHRWLQRISHYQRPIADSGRALWLTPAEHATLSR